MKPGKSVILGTGPRVYGYPLTSLAQLPSGHYWVQALLNVYTTFHRSDGSVVSLHLPCGDGNDLFISPGNLVSQPALRVPAPRSQVSAASHAVSGAAAATAGPPRGHLSAGQPAELGAREAHQDRKPGAGQVLGPPHVHRGRHPAPARLLLPGEPERPLPGHLEPDPLPLREPVRVHRARHRSFLAVLAIDRRAEGHHCGDPPRKPLLRRLIRRELGEPGRTGRPSPRNSCLPSMRTSGSSTHGGPEP